MGSNPISAVGHVALVFSPVKVKVAHPPPTGVLSSSPFLPHTVSSPPPPPPPPPLAGSSPGLGQESVVELEAPIDVQQPETSGFQAPDQPESSVPQSGHRVFSSPLENLYPDRPQDPEPVFGQPDREPVAYDDLPEDPASESETDPQEKDRILSEDQSYREMVRGVRAYMEWSFIPDREYTAQSKPLDRHQKPTCREDFRCLSPRGLVLQKV